MVHRTSVDPDRPSRLAGACTVSELQAMLMSFIFSTRGPVMALKLASMPTYTTVCCSYNSRAPKKPGSFSELSPADHTLGLMNCSHDCRKASLGFACQLHGTLQQPSHACEALSELLRHCAGAVAG